MSTHDRITKWTALTLVGLRGETLELTVKLLKEHTGTILSIWTAEMCRRKGYTSVCIVKTRCFSKRKKGSIK